jgi:CRISPR-associated endonuclease/helicase Cas3
MDFDAVVARATDGLAPYAYQRRLAEQGLPDLLCAPTGAGKTLAAVLPWLYRRTSHADKAVREATPRWLVVVLPQRVLVEQTAAVVAGWVDNLGSSVGVHVLMGGVAAGDREWQRHPAHERIFVGTQDMVLSRLLMRGFAEGPRRWPMTFGLFNSGVQFVFDEVQLLGPGLGTSLQLQAFRELLGTAQPCQTMWMSATVDREQLRTVDFRRELSMVGLDEQDAAGELRVRLAAVRTVWRLRLAEDPKRYAAEVAARAVAEHRAGTRTLVVLNTVDRATAVFQALHQRQPPAQVVLLHSRFRPGDRAGHLERALAEPPPAGTIVVATQVLEAGVDVTSTTLLTESAPWSSIVQRAGRCNRDGRAEAARLLWMPPPRERGSHRPYEQEDLAAAEQVLASLEGKAVTSTQLTDVGPPQRPQLHPLLRRRDLLDLFDTAPDLSGNDIDVSQFVRDQDNRTVPVAWRPPPPRGRDRDDDEPAVGREELCPAPIADVKAMAVAGRARVFDRVSGQWRLADRDDVRPGAVVVLDAAKGGYLPERGFAPSSTEPVAPAGRAAMTGPGGDVDSPEAIEEDTTSVGFRRWVSLAEHLADVEREAAELLDELGPTPGLSGQQRAAVVLAGRYHDLGKAHPVFARSLREAGADNPPPTADSGGPWAKSGSRRRLRHEPPHFSHELVGALLLADAELGLLDGVPEAELVTFLVSAHHGRVRVSVRGRPDERRDRILGVTEGDVTLPCAVPGVGDVPPRRLSLAATGFGAASLTARALELRDRSDLGPFRTAFCEAVVIAADWRASRAYEQPEAVRQEAVRREAGQDG